MKIKDIVSIVTPPVKIPNTQYSTSGIYPIIDQGQDYIAGYTNDAGKTITGNFILFGDHTCAVKLSPHTFAQGADGLKILKCKDGFDTGYIYYAIRAMNYNDGKYRRHWSEFKELTLPAPTLSTQRQISTSLLSIDKVINANHKLVTSAGTLINLIYNYWFVQFDFPGENGRPYKSSGGKMVYNDQLKQEIPEGWECKKLIDLFDFVRGTEVGSDAYADKKISDDYIRFWRVRDVGNDCKTWIDGNARNLTTVKPGDVVITLDGTVGKIDIDLDGAISGGLRHVVDHTNTISNATICTILQSDYIQESLRQYVSGRGSILAHASGALQHLAIPYNKNIFNKFQNIIQPMFDLMVNCKEQSKQLASLRDWLLPMLMNGQVEIKE